MASPSISMRSVPFGSMSPERCATDALNPTFAPTSMSVLVASMLAARSRLVAVASREPMIVLLPGAASPAVGSAMASTK